MAESKEMKITKDMTIGEALKAKPEAAMVMMQNGMHCIGCHVATSESIEDGCKAHGMSEDKIDDMIKQINEM